LSSGTSNRDDCTLTVDAAAAIAKARCVFVAVGTPQRADGSADLSILGVPWSRSLPHLATDAIVVIKSTVPVGTNAKAAQLLAEVAGRPVDVGRIRNF